MIYRLGETYFVRPLAEADVFGSYPRWFEDQDVCRYNSHGKFFKPLEYYREYVAAIEKESRLVWAICHDVDGHVGNVSLQEITRIDRNADFGIMLGDRRHWGRGLGFLAAQRMFAHGFDKLNLERIYCSTAATNAGMRRVAEKLGMTHEGTRRGHIFLEGARVDVVDFGIRRGEFTARPS